MKTTNLLMDLLRAFLVSPNGIMENMLFQTQFFITAHNISPPLDAMKRKDFFPDSTVPKTDLADWKIPPFSIGNTSSNGGFSIAMLVFVGG